MKVLVTGGCGFIGSHLIEYLLERGYEVINVDNLSAENEKFYINKKVKNYKFDVSNTKKLTQVSRGCNYVFHLAAESRLQSAIQNPQKAVKTNVQGTLSVLESCRQNKMGIVFSSTSSVYGLSDTFPIIENLKENCLNPYASTKYAAELLIRNYNKLHGIPATILRYFNVFGERAPSYGPYALVTGIFLKQKENSLPLTIVGDGMQKRDFIYVKDVAKANVISMEMAEKVPQLNHANVFNIGSGTETTIIELAKIISDNIVFIPERKGEAINNLCSFEKFASLTDWKPSVTILNWIKKKTI